MSHTLTLKDIHLDKAAVKIAALNMGVKVRDHESFRFSDGRYVEGTAVYLKKWVKPVIITEDGSVSYDNYGGRWGDIKQLSELTGKSLAVMSGHDLSQVTLIETNDHGIMELLVE